MRTLARLWPLLRPVAGWVALAIGLGALAMLANIALIATSGWFITAMAVAGAAGVSMNFFTPGALIRGFAIARTAGRYAERVVGHEATLRFVGSLRPWLFAQLLPLAPAALADLRDGDLLSRLRADVDRLELIVLRVVAPVAVAVIVLVPCLAWLAWNHAGVAGAVAVLMALAGVLLPFALHRHDAPIAARLAGRQARFNASLVDHVEGLAELAVYDPAHSHRLALLEQGEALLADERSLAASSALANAAVVLAANLALLATLLLGLLAFQAGRLAAPDVPMLALLALALFEAVAPLPLALQSLPAALASARRILAVTDRQPAIAEPAAPLAPPMSGGLVFERAGLTYRGAAAPALREISLDLSPGRRIGLVGASGAGKSSLVALAMRFVAPDSGRITFAGQPVEAFDSEALRARIALLAQDAHLFSGTVRENLLVADPGATDDEMWRALALAGILPFVEAQPDGLDTFVGALGAKLSGGEARRIALARTLLKRAPVLILDEPTEGLDAAAGRALLDGIRAARAGEAMLVITHQPELLVGLDDCVRLENGRLVA